MTERIYTPEQIAAALLCPCAVCNAKPGELCTSIINAIKVREVPHALRIAGLVLATWSDKAVRR